MIDLIKKAETSDSFAKGILTVKDNSTTAASLNFGTGYTLADFALTSDGNLGTFIKFT